MTDEKIVNRAREWLGMPREGLDRSTERPAPLASPFTATELLKRHFPETRKVVARVLYEGLTILGGRAKQGKSWLMLGTASPSLLAARRWAISTSAFSPSGIDA